MFSGLEVAPDILESNYYILQPYLMQFMPQTRLAKIMKENQSDYCMCAGEPSGMPKRTFETMSCVHGSTTLYLAVTLTSS